MVEIVFSHFRKVYNRIRMLSLEDWSLLCLKEFWIAIPEMTGNRRGRDVDQTSFESTTTSSRSRRWPRRRRCLPWSSIRRCRWHASSGGEERSTDLQTDKSCTFKKEKKHFKTYFVLLQFQLFLSFIQIWKSFFIIFFHWMGLTATIFCFYLLLEIGIQTHDF